MLCSIGDSLDLVPIAAFHGRGKRTGNHLIGYLHGPLQLIALMASTYSSFSSCVPDYQNSPHLGLNCFDVLYRFPQVFMAPFFLLAMTAAMKNFKAYAKLVRLLCLSGGYVLPPLPSFPTPWTEIKEAPNLKR